MKRHGMMWIPSILLWTHCVRLQDRVHPKRARDEGLPLDKVRLVVLGCEDKNLAVDVRPDLDLKVDKLPCTDVCPSMLANRPVQDMKKPCTMSSLPMPC